MTKNKFKRRCNIYISYSGMYKKYASFSGNGDYAGCISEGYMWSRFTNVIMLNGDKTEQSCLYCKM